MNVKRGEIYWVDFEPVKGSEQGGLRPALIIQNDIGNHFGATTVVAALTRTVPAKLYPFLVLVEPEESGLPVRSVINCSQLATIQQQGAQSRFRPPPGEGDVRPIGRLGPASMRAVDEALRFNLSLR